MAFLDKLHLPKAVIRRLGRRLIRCFAAAALACIVVTGPTQAQKTTDRELEAEMLFRFAQFVEWPPAAFSSPQAPFVIGVLGVDPFGPFLDERARGETARNRSLVVQRFRRVEDITTCHILFISGSEDTRYERIIAMLQKRPILTVGDVDSFLNRGGMIRFRLSEENKVEVVIDPRVARAAGLTISSSLLRAAKIVGTERVP